MTDFWSNVLGGGRAEQQPQPRRDPITPPKTAWWADSAPEPQQPRQGQFVPGENGSLDTPDNALRGYKSRATKPVAACPQCGSDAYVPLINNAAASCPECGYNTKFFQAGGMSASRGAASGAARQTFAGGRGGGSRVAKSITEGIGV